MTDDLYRSAAHPSGADGCGGKRGRHRGSKGSGGSRPIPEDRDCVKWAHRVNSRWLVHHGLNETTQAYLDHLAATDSARLQKACRVAWLLVHKNGEGEDPKPRFYGGLFSLCTPEEADRFLCNHLFTGLIGAPMRAAELDALPTTKNLSKATYEKILELRAQVKESLSRDSNS